MSLEGKLYYAKDLLIHNEEWCYASPFLPYIEAVIPLLFGQRDMKRAIEAMKIGKYALPLWGKMQLGLLLQIIQNEHPSADKAMLPIGQISLH